MYLRPPSTPLRATLLACALLLGCEPALEADLLAVHGVAPHRIEPGRTLTIEGAGFPAGRPARVRLEGSLHVPGAAPRSITLATSGRAVAADRIEARFDPRALDGVTERGTFRGRVTVLFRAAARGHEVIGRSDEQVLDVHPEHGDGVGEELARARRAAQLVDALGLVLGEEPPRDPGLPVEVVIAGSIAERAGLVSGDRVVELEGVRLHRLSDAIPPPGASRVSLRVERRGEPAPFHVTLPLTQGADGPGPETVVAALAALAWVLALLLLLAPSASLLDGLARRGRVSVRALGATRIRKAWRSREIGRWVIGAACLAAWPVLARRGWLGIPLEALLLAALAFRVSAAWLATDPTEGFWSRALAVGHALATVLGLSVALGAVAAFGGTTDVSSLAAQQSVWPWTWTTLSTPIGPLALALAFAALSSAPPGLARGTHRAARWARDLDDVVVLGAAATTTAILLGGWHVGTEASELAHAAGGLSFFALAAVSCLWLRRARRLGRTRRGTLLGGVVLTALVAGATVLRITGEPLPALEIALARTFGVAAVAAIVLALVRLALGRVGERPEPLHPFL